jgi:cysteinyl-tRNA synthetase
MTLDEFRLEMASYRRAADDDAKSLKDPQIALEKLRALYRKFDDAERQMADQVLSEWASSDSEGLRFDALALIDEMKIDMAIPALHELAARLTSSTEPSAPYELKKVQRIIAGLGTSERAR